MFPSCTGLCCAVSVPRGDTDRKCHRVAFSLCRGLGWGRALPWCRPLCSVFSTPAPAPAALPQPCATPGAAARLGLSPGPQPSPGLLAELAAVINVSDGAGTCCGVTSVFPTGGERVLCQSSHALPLPGARLEGTQSPVSCPRAGSGSAGGSCRGGSGCRSRHRPSGTAGAGHAPLAVRHPLVPSHSPAGRLERDFFSI